MAKSTLCNQSGDDCTARFGLDWGPLESVQQAPVYQPDPVRDSVDSTQGREHTVSDPRYPDVKPRLAQHPTVQHTDGRYLWECISGGFDKPREGWLRYGNGWTPEEAYAEWKEDIAP